MIDVRHIGPVVLYTCQLPSAATRREAELAAVQSLLCEAFPDGFLLEHAPSGLPVLAGRTERISISHSRSRAALAVCAGAPVGVDTETARSQLARVAPRVLSEAELAEYGSVPGGLLTAWTLKEAIYKAALTPVSTSAATSVCRSDIKKTKPLSRFGESREALRYSSVCRRWR